ncbi:aldo/keto reductase [Microbacterium sp. NPDC078428]|uniref:aldo/keto reductase n=1 Tax=Microbacterium sp. NPDC078428 TaxID=3364190 RepID=UPI0037CAAE60
MSAALPAPRIALNDGHRIPQLGFGVFQVSPDEAERIVGEALDAGYRHIDTAMIYGNEEGVGRAIASRDIPRDELFITTKLFRGDHGHNNALRALPASLERLGLDYVDLYLIHWPAPARNAYVDSWRAFEQMRNEGLARSIGVCNFLPEHLARLQSDAETLPAVNQIELHPLFAQRDLRAYQEPLGIVTESWAPLGQGKYVLDELPGIAEIARRHGKSAAQVILGWHLQQGLVVFPKTVRRERMIENADVFDFVLDDAEMAQLARLDSGTRIGAHPRERN